MVGRRDDDRIDFIELEQIFNVGEYVGDLHPLGDCAGLRAVIITQGDELCAFHSGESWQMRELGDRARADETEPDGLARCPGFFDASRRFGQSLFPGNKSLESYETSDLPAHALSRPTDTSRCRGHNRGH